jgi:hypothetical protein
MQLFRSPLFQEVARPVVASYRERAYGNRYGRRSVSAQELVSVTLEARIEAARELAAEATTIPPVVHYDQAA